MGAEFVGLLEVEPEELDDNVDKEASCASVISHGPVVDVLHVVQEVNYCLIAESKQLHHESNRDQLIKDDNSAILSFLWITKMIRVWASSRASARRWRE